MQCAYTPGKQNNFTAATMANPEYLLTVCLSTPSLEFLQHLLHHLSNIFPITKSWYQLVIYNPAEACDGLQVCELTEEERHCCNSSSTLFSTIFKVLGKIIKKKQHKNLRTEYGDGHNSMGYKGLQ